MTDTDTSPAPRLSRPAFEPSDPSRGIAAADPELLELPDPPKRQRTLTVAVLLLTAVLSLLMMIALRRDATYAFASSVPVELGELRDAPLDRVSAGTLVRAQGMLGAALAIRYERPLTEGSFRLMPVAGRTNVWAEVRVPAGAETRRFVPPSEFVGRLVRFDAAGPKHRGLAAAVKGTTGQEIPGGAWLLVDGDVPSNARWAAALMLMFAGFAAWNLFAAASLLRRVR